MRALGTDSRSHTQTYLRVGAERLRCVKVLVLTTCRCPCSAVLVMDSLMFVPVIEYIAPAPAVTYRAARNPF